MEYRQESAVHCNFQSNFLCDIAFLTTYTISSGRSGTMWNYVRHFIFGRNKTSWRAAYLQNITPPQSIASSPRPANMPLCSAAAKDYPLHRRPLTVTGQRYPNHVALSRSSDHLCAWSACDFFLTSSQAIPKNGGTSVRVTSSR